MKILLLCITLVSLNAKAEETLPTPGWYKAAVIGVSLNPTIGFNGTASTVGASGSGDLRYDLDAGINIGFEMSQFNQHSWNSGFEIDYSNLKYNEARIHYAGNKPTQDLDGRLQLLSIAYSGKYLWESFYIPVGIGISGLSQTDNSATTDSLKTGGVFWIGAGTTLEDNLNFEIVTRIRSMKSDPVSFAGYNFDPDRGLMTEWLVSAKILF